MALSSTATAQRAHEGSTAPAVPWSATWARIVKSLAFYLLPMLHRDSLEIECRLGTGTRFCSNLYSCLLDTPLRGREERESLRTALWQATVCATRAGQLGSGQRTRHYTHFLGLPQVAAPWWRSVLYIAFLPLCY